MALLVACEMQGESPYLTKPLIRAAVSGGQVFVSPNRNSQDAPKWSGQGNVDLVYQDISGNGKPIACINPATENTIFQSILHRWHVDRTRFRYLSYDNWNNSSVEPLRQNILIGSPLLDDVKKMNGKITSLPNKIPHPDKDRSSGLVYDAGPFGWQTRTMLRLTPLQYHFVFFDFWPIADGQYEWYVSEPGLKGLSHLTRWDSSRSPEKGAKWTETGSWTGTLAGDFYVVASGADRYFMSGSDGRIFLAPRGGKPGDPLKEVWTESPVALLLHDADAGKSYAFTKEQYFEITDPIQPKPHTVTFRFPISRQWDAYKALDTAAKCGRVIRGLPEPPAVKP